MEKIMNMPTKASMPASPVISHQIRSSVQETKDDFIRLLQQQKESTGQPTEAKDAGKPQDLKAEQKPEEKQPEKPMEEPEEEPDLKETVADLAQMELQQSILQQAVIQVEEPVAVDPQVGSDAEAGAMDAVVMEMVQESAEIPPDVSVLPEQLQAASVKPEEKAEPVKPGVVTENKAESVKAKPGSENKAESVKTGANPEKADSVKPETPKQAPEASVEEEQITSVMEQHSSEYESQTAVPEKQDNAQDRKETFTDVQKDLGYRGLSQTASMQTAEAPVQTGRFQDVVQTGFQEEGQTVRSTVEELPQELGKAVTAGRAGDSQVLTVELEPASLGKLTIRLEYEAGRTMVSVMASNPKTLELLSEKASEIASILKEHTGEETVIYTEQPQREPGEDAQEQGSRGGQQQERQQHRQEEQSQTDSFMQQLRLGLV